MLGSFRQLLLQESLVCEGARVLVAVSGGADSMALLHLLHRLSPELGFFLAVAHLDHSIRSVSADDANFVSLVCSHLGVPFYTQRVDVPGLARGHGWGIEEAARNARLVFLKEAAARFGCSVIALGHHRGDQAETVLHRLMRGSGAGGLGAMRMRRGEFIRPLLSFSRGQILGYLGSCGIAWVEDESNLELVYTRNRIRHSLLPLMGEFNPRIEERLERLSRRFAQDEDYLRVVAFEALGAVRLFCGDGLRLGVEALVGLSPAIRGRVLRLALAEVRGDLLGIEERHVDALIGLVSSNRPQSEISLPGCWVARRYDSLWFRREAPGGFSGFSLSLDGPGRVVLPGGGVLTLSLGPSTGGAQGPWVAEFDPSVVRFPLIVRTFLPGDRIRLFEGGGRKKVKELFCQYRVELELRKCWPLVESDEILWVCGLRTRFGSEASGSAGPVLRISVEGFGGMSNDL